MGGRVGLGGRIGLYAEVKPSHLYFISFHLSWTGRKGKKERYPGRATDHLDNKFLIIFIW